MELDDVIKDIRDGLVLCGSGQTIGIELLLRDDEWIARPTDDDSELAGVAPTPAGALARLRIAVIDAVREVVKHADAPTKWLKNLQNKPPMKTEASRG